MQAVGSNGFRQRAVAYCHYPDGYVGSDGGGAVEEPRWLFSFVGSRNVVVRGALLELSHPRGLVRDTSGFNIYDGGDEAEHAARRMREYVETLKESKFVLCPRGLGTSSIRLYETLALGRVPVILSDKWVAPEGPDWAAFSLPVEERDAGRVAG